MIPSRIASALLAGTFVLAGCSESADHFQPAAPAFSAALDAADSPATSQSYIIFGVGKELPADLVSRVEAAGGVVEDVTPQLGIALVRVANADAMKAISGISGVSGVAANLPAYRPPVRGVEEAGAELAEAIGNPPFGGDDDIYSNLQWNNDAVDAVEAWNAGYRGRGVRVAVLDDGIRSNHPDLAANLNRALSTSFVKGETYDNPPGGHGTHTSGTIAAADNGLGVIGVAPEAEIVMVKVLSAVTGSGDSYNTMKGLVYAADIGARVINMSLGIRVPFPRSGWFTDTKGTPDPADDEPIHFPAAAYTQFVNAYADAVSYARQKGAVVIASAGNETIDMHNLGSFIKLPAELPGVLSISAVGPMGWAINPATNLDVLASYSNFGKNGIDLAAPGGNYDLPGDATCSVVFRSGSLFYRLTNLCYAFDGVLSTTVGGGYGWKFGTSMAAPHVSGVAALVAGKLGPMAGPGAIEAAIRQGADDLGQLGQDDTYGHGRVNAYRSVMK